MTYAWSLKSMADGLTVKQQTNLFRRQDFWVNLTGLEGHGTTMFAPASVTNNRVVQLSPSPYMILIPMDLVVRLHRRCIQSGKQSFVHLHSHTHTHTDTHTHTNTHTHSKSHTHTDTHIYALAPIRANFHKSPRNLACCEYM
jgi:hypothetical protein